MNQTLVQGTLTGLGLSQNEAKVYMTMLSRPDFSATDAASAADVPPQMIYRILGRMMEKGFCSQVSSRPRRFTITDPAIAIDTLVHRQDTLLQEARTLLPDLEEIFSGARQNGKGFGGVEILRDLETAIAMSQQLNLEAREEILFFVKPPYLGNRKSIRRQVEGLPRRDNPHHPSVRGLYETHDRAQLFTDQIERSIEVAGEEARLANLLPIKATIYDRRRVIIHMKNKELQQVTWHTLVIEHEDLASILALTFESIWQQAEDYWSWRRKHMA